MVNELNVSTANRGAASTGASIKNSSFGRDSRAVEQKERLGEKFASADTIINESLNSAKVSGGLELALPCLVFALAGLWLDRVLGLTPVFTIVGSLLGFVGASLNVYYRYVAEMEKHEAERIEARAALIRQSNEEAASIGLSQTSGS